MVCKSFRHRRVSLFVRDAKGKKILTPDESEIRSVFSWEIELDGPGDLDFDFDLREDILKSYKVVVFR
jgi:hypothetical protein